MIGFLNLIKPGGITSHDLVNRVRRITGLKQVGHAGTLDPLATGVMVVGLSKACRLLQYLPDDKCYLAEILLGTRTDTDDIEGEVLEKKDLPALDPVEIEERLQKFLGKQIQIPPVYSAIKQGGRKLYELARKGEAPRELKGREVEILNVEFLSFQSPLVKARIACSKGTYIRSIARDLGNQLGIGGCLHSLVRERSGSFKIEDAFTLEELEEKGFEDCLVSPQEALALKALSVERPLAKRIANGQRIALADFAPQAVPDESRLFISCEEKPVALMKRLESPHLGPEVVLANANHF